MAQAQLALLSYRNTRVASSCVLGTCRQGVEESPRPSAPGSHLSHQACPLSVPVITQAVPPGDALLHCLLADSTRPLLQHQVRVKAQQRGVQVVNGVQVMQTAPQSPGQHKQQQQQQRQQQGMSNETGSSRLDDSVVGDAAAEIMMSALKPGCYPPGCQPWLSDVKWHKVSTT